MANVDPKSAMNEALAWVYWVLNLIIDLGVAIVFAAALYGFGAARGGLEALGRVNDTLIAQAALRAQAVGLVTLNAKHFVRLGEDVQRLVLSPEK